jgi:hypothetical protein
MNFQAVADVVNELYILLIAFSALLGIFLVFQGGRRLVWSSQFGGMNSMGSRSFTSEAMGYFFGGFISVTIIHLLSQMRKDFFGMEEFSWTTLETSESPIAFAESFFFAAFGLLGIWLVIKAALAAPKIADGKETAGSVMMLLALALACVSARDINTAISGLTVFNPLTFFSG